MEKLILNCHAHDENASWRAIICGVCCVVFVSFFAVRHQRRWLLFTFHRIFYTRTFESVFVNFNTSVITNSFLRFFLLFITITNSCSLKKYAELMNIYIIPLCELFEHHNSSPNVYLSQPKRLTSILFI